MAFQSSVLRDGEWVTETVNFQDALKASTAPKLAAEPRPEVPTCGILSSTVVESPIIHWIFPVRLRSQCSNDVAFIGDRFVQISELREDGQAHEIIRKSDFGTRIRNAVVLGSPPPDGFDNHPSRLIKPEDSDVLMKDATKPPGTERPRHLPPQLLVLALESGDCVFLFIRERADGTPEIITTRYESPRNLKYLGFHFAASPTSHYIAAASAEGAFVVYELESLETLSAQYMRDGSFKPVKSIRIRPVNGVISKMEFLHPKLNDDYHINLLLVIARRDGNHHAHTSFLAHYEWELGDDLKSVFAQEKPGSRLPDEHQMPLLMIPLRFNTAFLVVSEESIGMVKCTMEGPTGFEALVTNAPGPTKLHHGAGEPLWTAWSRPFRRREYFEKKDIIYLAREDGFVIHVEIDEHDLLTSVTHVGAINTNISTAFTTAYDLFADVLIIGGDSGSGGIWKIPARSTLVHTSTIPNWSPVIDLATTDEYPSWTAEAQASELNSIRRGSSSALRKPDRIFCTAGRGPNSSLTELRWGIQARIGLEFEYDQPVRQSWMFPVEIRGEMGFYAVLSLPHSSDVLHLSSDFTNANALTPDASPFDTTSRTIYAVHNAHGTIVQITEASVTLVAPSQSSRHNHADILRLGDIMAENAFCKDDLVVISSHKDQASQLHILEIDQMNVSRAMSWDAQGEVTCISIFTYSEQTLIVSGSVMDGSPWISIYSSEGGAIVSEALNDVNGMAPHGQMEAFTSISVLTEGVDDVVLVFGTRSGHLVTGRVGQQGTKRISFSVERLGMAPVNVFTASHPFGGDAAVFACCDNSLIVMTDFSQRHLRFQTKNPIWPTDSNDSSLPSPPIHSVHCLEQSLSGYRGHMSLMMLAGSRILLAEMWPHVGPVPRNIPLEGTPFRVIYSQTWKCFIVAHLKNHGPTLSFVDPDSGEIISSPADKDMQSSEYISGLGQPGDKVFGLSEWLYVKDGRTFCFIIVTTQQGLLLIVSVTVEEIETSNGRVRHLRYWTRYKKKGFEEPIYSVVGDAAGLLFCVGSVLHWEVLDLVDKKLKPMKQFQLDSPGVSLQITNGKVCVLTTSHSLQVVDLHVESEATDISLIHSDQVTRYTWHLIEVGDSVERSRKWPVNLVSTGQGGIAGLWVPWGQRNKELGVVFEGILPTSVRRFRRGRTRPLWLSVDRERRYNSLSSTVDGAEILGISLDGSLQHFSLIGLELWRFLRLIQNLAQLTPAICPFTYDGFSKPDAEMDMDLDLDLEPQPYPDMMHINGDVLRRCLDLRALENLTTFGDGLDLFYEYLDDIGDGAYTAGFRDGVEDGRERYFELGYDILTYLLAPVF
ncbi:mono-functional DNA-alkylating methyl methanesulfonate N-term-domain-containing protein [Ilyonectria robusta]|uniref:mono-functional DNA-alkylating methyl methanesulfonate N-term-domain-containing protein n=1 Tax=Ilyonectria robusta TaxID=1079257 RepID=UPI001E8D65D2|nr:mono-functional DNA-alkylating methyl methanesulfonate N-term-domain-containing protein [Ilyonectria robusta]KAH8736684.1 mono-functional DNA-alkylating methyl methanesulfonate N-term-domain-containing protein [Ilyonectria robusta]